MTRSEDEVPGRATKLDRPSVRPPDADVEAPQPVIEAEAAEPATVPPVETADEAPAEAEGAPAEDAPVEDAPASEEAELAEPGPAAQTGPRLSRREARTRALEVLFAADVRDAMPSTVLDSEVVVDLFTRRLVEVVVANRMAVDALIGEHAEGWTISRMPAVDRSILRLGTAEMLFVDEVPPKVAIDEAVELAKSLSTDASPKFVNGVLAAIARAHDLV